MTWPKPSDRNHSRFERLVWVAQSKKKPSLVSPFTAVFLSKLNKQNNCKKIRFFSNNINTSIIHLSGQRFCFAVQDLDIIVIIIIII